MTDAPNAYQTALDQLRAERDAALKSGDGWRTMYDQTAALLHDTKRLVADLQARVVNSPSSNDQLRCVLDAVTAERDDLAAKLGSGWIEREVDVRVLKDAQVSSLRDQLNAMTDARDGAIARADQCEQDAHVSRTNLNTLSAMFRAAISAVVRA